jgi:hypothetical protein
MEVIEDIRLTRHTLHSIMTIVNFHLQLFGIHTVLYHVKAVSEKEKTT